MTTAKHCQHCGGLLEQQVNQGDSRLVCNSCKKTHYDQLLIGVGALIEQDGCLLLIRRAKEPFAQAWALPGGHVEADEDPQERAMVEVWEETSLKAEPNGVAGVYFHKTHPRGPALFISYWAKVIAGTPTASEEASECKFFARSQLPAHLAEGGHSLAIAAWQENETFLPNTRAGLERHELGSQLSNGVNLRSSQDQVLWTIFGAFWATNAILLVALFTTGDFPSNHWVGVVLGAVGAALSVAWHQIQNRAIHHIVRHEKNMQRIESQLRVPPYVAISAELSGAHSVHPLQRGPQARTLMRLCSIAALVLWLAALVAFTREVSFCELNARQHVPSVGLSAR